MNDGFIKIYRSLLGWEWYKNPNTKIVFLHLLLTANWEETVYRGHRIPRGSLVCGRKKLSKDLGLSEQEIRTALNHLKSTNEITIKPTNKFSVITIVNWEKFQGYESKVNQQANQQNTTKSTTYKEIKNKRNKEYYKSGSRYETEYDFEAMEREYGLK